MDSRYQSYSTVSSYQVGASLSISGNPAQTVNIITFDSNFAVNILQGVSPTGYATIVRPSLTSGDTDKALVTATSESPRILAYNQTGGTVAGLPAYSIATEQWDNGYSIGVGDLVIFEPATNPIWNTNRTVGCAELQSSLYQAEYTVRQLHNDIVRTSKRVDEISDIDLSNFMLSDYSIESGMVLCSSTAYSLNVSSGEGRYKGQNFNYASGYLCSFTDKSLCLIEVKTDGNIVSNYENSTGGTFDADYTASVIPGSASPAWTATGTASTETISNDVFNLATSANYRTYDRTGVAGAPASGSTMDAIVQWVSGTGNRIEIDDGTYRCELSIEQNQVKLINDDQLFNLDTAVPFHLRLTLKDGNTEVYVNGYNALSSTTQLASISNRFRFGCYDSYSVGVEVNTTSQFKIARVITKGSAAVVPSFSTNSGVVIGSVVTVNNAYSPSLGLQLEDNDISLDYRHEGRLTSISDLSGNSPIIKEIRTSIGLPTNYHDVPLAYLTAATIKIVSGSRCRDTADTVDIVFASDYTIDITDTTPDYTQGGASSAEAASTTYYLYAGLDSSARPIAWLDTADLSTGGTPTNPVTYSTGRRQILDNNTNNVFSIPNDASSNLVPFANTVFPEYKVRSEGVIDGDTGADITGTYVRTGTTVVLTLNSGHKIVTGHQIYADFTSGTAVDGLFTVTASDATTVTFTHGTSGNTSGNVTLKRAAIKRAQNLAFVTQVSAGDLILNWDIQMPDALYSIKGTPQHVTGQGTGNANTSIMLPVDATWTKTAYCVRIYCQQGPGGIVASQEIHYEVTR